MRVVEERFEAMKPVVRVGETLMAVTMLKVEILEAVEMARAEETEEGVLHFQGVICGIKVITSDSFFVLMIIMSYQTYGTHCNSEYKR